MILATTKHLEAGRQIRIAIGGGVEEAFLVTKSERINDTEWLIEAETTKSSVSIILNPEYLIELVLPNGE